MLGCRWLNLFADAVHNFTDGMAIGAAFGSGGPVSGWAKTMFIMAHELPQEVGDYGILLSAGFSSWQVCCPSCEISNPLGIELLTAARCRVLP